MRFVQEKRRGDDDSDDDGSPNPRRRSPRHEAATNRISNQLTHNALVGLDKAEFGFTKELLSNKKFTTRFETLTKGNNRGYGVNPKGDRLIYVISGSLFVSHEGEDKVVECSAIHAGLYFSAEAGKKHGYATSATQDVSILVVESANYEKNWEELTAPIVVQPTEIQVAAQSVRHSPQYSEKRRDRSLSNAKRQAEEEQQNRDRGSSKGSPKVVNPFDVLSNPNLRVTNPRAVGPSGL